MVSHNEIFPSPHLKCKHQVIQRLLSPLLTMCLFPICKSPKYFFFQMSGLWFKGFCWFSFVLLFRFSKQNSIFKWENISNMKLWLTPPPNIMKLNVLNELSHFQLLNGKSAYFYFLTLFRLGKAFWNSCMVGNYFLLFIYIYICSHTHTRMHKYSACTIYLFN